MTSNIQIMRAFVRLRQLLASHENLARKLTSIEKKYDAQFKVVFDAIRQLMATPDDLEREQIDFRIKKIGAVYHVRRKPGRKKAAVPKQR